MDASWPLLTLPPNVLRLLQQYRGQLDKGDARGTDEERARAITADLAVGKGVRDTFTFTGVVVS